ncbi:MAG TPA: PAS domain-containing sensor histidine kinase [Longimicrobiaceae bacterium]|nr:PAS domain-containing sensor histidine kinase [Longimicrobiaceae bacterium]
MKPEDFRAVAHLFPAACVLLNGSGEIIASNPAAERLSGLSRSDLEGATLSELVLEDREVVLRYLRSASRTRGPLVGRLTFASREGVPCTCFAGAAVPPTDGRPSQIMLQFKVPASSTDRFRLLNEQIDQLASEVRKRMIAEREREGLLKREQQARSELEARTRDLEQATARIERARREAELARAEAESANKAKSDFLASMSHELRTPLNVIGGYVELVQLGIHGPVSADQHKALVRIAANQKHLLTVINDILSFAKVEAGQIEFDVRPLAGVDLLAGLEPLVAPLAGARGIAYSVQECSPSLYVLGDEERVRQILLNLVGNAVKFTDPGGWVLLTCEADPSWVDIHVRDNGPGIPPEKQQSIFDPFTQVTRGLTRPHEGVGLGLAISRDLARGMGGDVSVESAPDQGSTFTLRLPRATAAGDRDA